jgi:hypothetical protein
MWIPTLTDDSIRRGIRFSRRSVFLVYFIVCLLAIYVYLDPVVMNLIVHEKQSFLHKYDQIFFF